MAQWGTLFSALEHYVNVLSLHLFSGWLLPAYPNAKSTCTTLIFHTQLIVWKHIRLPAARNYKLAQFVGAIDNLLAQHGKVITKSYLGGLSGGAPWIIWPSYSKCLLSIMQHIISSTPGADEPYSALGTWLLSTLMANTQNITPEIGTSAIKNMCDLAKEGTKSKQKERNDIDELWQDFQGKSLHRHVAGLFDDVIPKLPVKHTLNLVWMVLSRGHIHNTLLSLVLAHSDFDIFGERPRN